jgi:hypothetical protein
MEKVNFSDMNMSEVEQWENRNNALVLFGAEEDTAISFQRCENEDDEWEDDELVILVDGLDKPIILSEQQVESLNAYLINNFSATKREIEKIVQEGRRREECRNKRVGC